MSKNIKKLEEKMKIIKIIKNKLFIGILLSFLILTNTFLYARQPESNVDYEKVQKSIRIMENILNTMLTEIDRDILPIRSTNTSSIYIHDYGVIFITSPSFDIGMIDFKPFIAFSNSRKEIESKIKIEKKKLDIAELYDSIIEFLTDYAVSIKELKSADKISVICKIPSRYENVLKEDFGIKDSRIFIVTEKRWLDDHRSGLLNIDELKNRIKSASESQYPDKKTDSRIDIFKSILESELEDKLNKNISKNQIDGIYINGLGTIFTINLERSGVFSGYYNQLNFDDFDNIQIPDVPDIPAPPPDVSVVPAPDKKKITIVTSKKAEKITEEKIAELTDVIAEIFADFGSTLKGIKNNERIEILVKSRDFAVKERKAKNIQFTIDKSSIDNYVRNSIDFNTFKNRIKTVIF